MRHFRDDEPFFLSEEERRLVLEHRKNKAEAVEKQRLEKIVEATTVLGRAPITRRSGNHLVLGEYGQQFVVLLAEHAENPPAYEKGPRWTLTGWQLVAKVDDLPGAVEAGNDYLEQHGDLNERFMVGPRVEVG